MVMRLFNHSLTYRPPSHTIFNVQLLKKYIDMLLNLCYSSFDLYPFKRKVRPYHIAIAINSIFPYIVIATISILQLLESTALSY